MVKTTEKPHLIRLLDFFVFIFPIGVITILTLIVQFNDLNRGGHGPLTLWCVTLVGWAISLCALIHRASWLASIKFVTAHGILIRPMGFPVSKLAIEVETARLLKVWAEVDPELGDAPTHVLDGTLVTFMPFPFESHGSKGLFAGLTYPRGKTSLVGYRDDIRTSAFAHEMNHIVYDFLIQHNGDYHAYSAQHRTMS